MLEQNTTDHEAEKEEAEEDDQVGHGAYIA
jgi:hypothetical protein